MSANFYSRGAEDRKPVSLHELHKARFGIVTVGAPARQRNAGSVAARGGNLTQPGAR